MFTVTCPPAAALPALAAIAALPKIRAPKVKADPAIIAKARELRDRWLEVNANGLESIAAKYDVARLAA